MKRSSFCEDKIIDVLREQVAAVLVANLRRKLGVSDAIVYKWTAKRGGMDASKAGPLKRPQDESNLLKRLFVDAKLDNAALK